MSRDRGDIDAGFGAGPPITIDARRFGMLRLLENAIRWQREPR